MTYKLVYFPMKGRAESIRWIMMAANVDFTEENIDPFNEWKDKKRDFDWGVVPVLMVNGQQLHQTTVIARYLGEAHNFISKDLWTVTRQQEVVESVHEVTYTIQRIFRARLTKDDPNRIKALFAQAKHMVTEIYQAVEKTITPEGWIHSDKMTWADVFVAGYLDVYLFYFHGCFENVPKCHEMLRRVREIPKIADWIKKRPGFHAFDNPEGLAD